MKNCITVIPFVIFPPKSDDFTDFCEGGKWQRPTKKILKKLFKKFDLILLKLYSKIHNF